MNSGLLRNTKVEGVDVSSSPIVALFLGSSINNAFQTIASFRTDPMLSTINNQRYVHISSMLFLYEDMLSATASEVTKFCRAYCDQAPVVNYIQHSKLDTTKYSDSCLWRRQYSLDEPNYSALQELLEPMIDFLNGCLSMLFTQHHEMIDPSILFSDTGCPAQHPHYDYPGTTDHNDNIKAREIPFFDLDNSYSVLIALQDCSIDLYLDPATDKMTRIALVKGDLFAWDVSVRHGGSAYANANVRIFFYVVGSKFKPSLDPKKVYFCFTEEVSKWEGYNATPHSATPPSASSNKTSAA